MATRRSLSAMSEQAQELFIMAVADLGYAAIKYAFEKGFRSKPRKIGNNWTSHAYRRWLENNGKSPTLAWDDTLGNLRDSFGSAVYVNGVLRKDTIRYISNTPTSKETDRYGKGREALLDYLNRIKPTSKKNEIYLVCVAAMPYANALERGTHAGGYKIRVISGARDYIDQHWHEVENKVYAKMGLRKPASRIKRGDVILYNDA